MNSGSTPVEQAVREIQQIFPAGFPANWEATAAVARILRRLCPAGGRLLDVGCGAMNKTAVFARLGFACAACDDFSDPWHREGQNLERLRDFAARAGIELHVLQERGAELPWPQESFDVVTLLEIVEHLHESPRSLLEWAGRTLKPGGLLLVTTPNGVNLRKRLWVLTGRSNYPPLGEFYRAQGRWRGHVREYTRAELETLLRWSGFEIVASRMFNGMLERRVGSGLLRAGFNALTRLLPNLADTICVAARKPPA